jgi:CBS domain-containing protein
MRDKHIGYLVVTEFDIGAQRERPVGVLTDRDIVVAVVARETDPRSLRVEDVMTRNPVLIAEDATVGKALHEMRRIGVRRVPVVDDRGYLAGVLSLDDIIEDLASGLGDVAGSIRHEIAVERALRS